MGSKTLAIPSLPDGCERTPAALSRHQQQALAASRRLSTLMDARWGLGPWRFGVETVADLIPGAGDAISIGVSLYQLGLARQIGVPLSRRRRMGVNVGVDALLGAVPFAGDLATTAFKAHLRNQRIIDEFVAAPAVQRRGLLRRLRRAA